MRKISCIALLMLAAALPVSAFSTSDLLSLVAMPLAVAAVADAAHVPQDQLASLLATLNQADVPPTQFVQTVRYAPVALGDQQFVPYVQQEVAQGVTGPALVTVIDQRLPQYGVTPQYVTVPATTYVEQPDYVYQPQVAYTTQPAYAYGNADPLALIAMPLAVAAVSDMANVPQDQLANLLATLNQADVPPAQFVQVVRYVPVALQDQQFVPYVQQQVSQGVTGPALVTVIDQRLPQYTPPPPLPSYVPAQTQVVEQEPFHGNPHGGPPGLIKKQLGLQTGAEVVHGHKPGRQFEARPMVAAPAPQPVVVEREHGHGRGHMGGPEGHGHGRGHAEAAPVFIPPQAAPQPVVIAPQAAPPGPPAGHGRGPDGQGPPGQMKEKGGHGHGKD